MATNLDISAGLDTASTTFEEGHSDLFQSGADLPGMYLTYTEVVRSEGKFSRHWLANHTRTRQWDGPRQISGPRHYNWDANPTPKEGTMVLKRQDLTRDKTGATAKFVGNWLRGELSAHDRFTADSYDGSTGAGPTGYDGVSLYNASHPHVASGSGRSNIGAGTNASHANYVAARAVGRLHTHENGDLANVVYSHMRVGPNLEGRAREITGANIVLKSLDLAGQVTTTAAVDAAGMDNVHKGEVVLMVDDRVTTYYWDLMDLNHGSDRPMALVIERDLEPWEQTDMNSPRRVSDDEFMWGHDGEFVPVAAMWILAYRGTGTA